ncbi:hypothetical protein GCM10027082_36320 [Comamonas humi]
MPLKARLRASTGVSASLARGVVDMDGSVAVRGGPGLAAVGSTAMRSAASLREDDLYRFKGCDLSPANTGHP